jgi:hypothetical protein
MAAPWTRRALRTVLRVLAALMVGGAVLGPLRRAPEPPPPQTMAQHDVADDGA